MAREKRKESSEPADENMSSVPPNEFAPSDESGSSDQRDREEGDFDPLADDASPDRPERDPEKAKRESGSGRERD